ncbi:secretory phospholipase A2 receptor-like [Mercenaria mercenaria]|uniref:secretory phospholipase A2 receptor-like n=1 Tax=Mercenaria mercenaria TaxID=6596 RepID=UPI00234E9E3B|nr:secretory phospholipase A2 receptor-like [Mercenaria mercenaria]
MYEGKIEISLILIACLFHMSSQFVLGGSASSIDHCPDTVAHGRYLHSFREKCYEFVIYKEKYWTEARHDCQKKGGDLVLVDDAAIQTFIVSTLHTLGNTKDGVWIGLTDRSNELHWQWVNGEHLHGYNNWAHLQGGANFLHLTQDCAQIRMDDGGRWHDRECHLWPQKFSYICEYEMSTRYTNLPKLSTSASTPTEFSSLLASSFNTKSESQQTSTKELQQTLVNTETPIKTLQTETPFSTDLSPNHSIQLLPVLPANIANSIKTSTFLRTLSTSKTKTSVFLHTAPVSKTGLNSPGTIQSHFTTDAAAINNKIETILITRHDSATPTKTLTTLRSVDNARTSTEKPVLCSELNCANSCPRGYAGVYVGLDGCIRCRCN